MSLAGHDEWKLRSPDDDSPASHEEEGEEEEECEFCEHGCCACNPLVECPADATTPPRHMER